MIKANFFQKIQEFIKNLFFSKKINKSNKINDNKEEPKENIFLTFFWAFLFAMILRSFWLEPFHIPSSSMYPNLLIGDYIFANKYSLGYSRYSFPLGLDLFPGRIFASQPKRGDAIVFRLPSNPSINYIKRLIGLPGDRIQVINGILYINDQEIIRNFDGETSVFEGDKVVKYQQYSEIFPDKRKIAVFDRDNTMQDNTGIFEVPAKHYFFMGDNRDDSQDSRFMTLVGFVPEENLVGKASFIFFSNPHSILNFIEWIKAIRFERIGKKINN